MTETATTETLTAEIHYTIEPDADAAEEWDSWADAPEDTRRAMDIRSQFGEFEDGADAISAEDFQQLYTEVATVDLTVDTEDPIADLESLWAAWNRGSGQESREFIQAETRSMSVGDIVVLRDSEGDRVGAYMAERFGFGEVAALTEGEDGE